MTPLLKNFPIFSHPFVPGVTSGEEPACQCKSSIPGLARSHGGEDGNPLQYSCLENPMDRGAWQATVHGVEKSQKQLK